MRLHVVFIKRTWLKILLIVALLVIAAIISVLLQGWLLKVSSNLAYVLGFQLAADKRIPIYSVKTDDKVVSISFDAAWGADKTLKILDTLRTYNVKTTFFLVSTWVNKYPGTARKIVEEGHELGLHSHTHPDMTKLSKEQIRRELLDNYKTIKEATGFEAKLFRPPFGAYNNTLIEIADNELGFKTIQWSVDSLDWKDVSEAFIADRVLSRIHKGAIVLFHNNGQYTASALPKILASLTSQGYRIVPISELLIKGPYYVDHEGKQIPLR